MKKIIIAIDGFSSTGKSTTAKAVAKALNYVYIDTGAMYRAVAYMAVNQEVITQHNADNSFQINEKKLLEKLAESEISFRYNSELGFSEIYLNGKNIEKEIRSIEIANKVSTIAKIKEVRAYLVDLQRLMGKDKGIVMDGRDIGSVVFPNAELKIFMTASEQIRAERRYNELISKGEVVDFQSVMKNIQERDFLDTTRQESPLIKTADAIEIDNSHLTINEQVSEIVNRAKAIIS